MTEKNANNTITETKTGDDKTFKGDGVEGKKGAGDGQDKPKQDKPKAQKGHTKKELHAKLGKAKSEDKKLCKEEDERGIMTGDISLARQARQRGIKDLEWQIKNHGKKG